MTKKEERSYKDYLGIPDLAGDYFILDGTYAGEGTFPVYLPTEFEANLRPFVGHIGVWDGLWTQWPELMADASVPARDFTAIGYGPTSRMPLHRIILHLILGLSRSEMEDWFRFSRPADELPANLTLDNVLIRPAGDKQEWVSLRVLYNMNSEEKSYVSLSKENAGKAISRIVSGEKVGAEGDLNAAFDDLENYLNSL